jgi:hypothetical protein
MNLLTLLRIFLGGRKAVFTMLTLVWAQIKEILHYCRQAPLQDKVVRHAFLVP